MNEVNQRNWQQFLKACQELEPDLQETESMLRSAFPSGVPEADYFPLLDLLYEEMSVRTVATVVANFTGKSHWRVYNDVLSAVSGQGADAAAKESVRHLLRRHGYDEWVSKGE